MTARVRTAAEFAADYRELRRAGLTHREIAERMGYRYKSMSKTLSRARSQGLLPPYEGADPKYWYRAMRIKAGA